MRRTFRWAVGMTVFGLIVAVCVSLVTGSLGWTLVGLLAAGFAANMVAHPAAKDGRRSCEPAAAALVDV